MNSPAAYDDLSDALARIGFTHGAAEYHGALVGALCVREAEKIDPLDLLGQPTRENSDCEQALKGLVEQQKASLSSTELGFGPMLPDDEESLAVRVRALVAWCEGFLYGLSTGGGLDLDRCTDEVRELVEDFTQFTRAGLSEQDDQELEEAAYAELIEYIRVGVQLLFMELHPRSRETPPQESPPTLH